MTDKYDAPKTWPEFSKLKVRMQRDVLLRAVRQGATLAEKAAIADMPRVHFSNTCRRFGIDPMTGDDL